MATLLNTIQSPYWQISTTGAGNIEQGVNDVRQCLDILLRTSKGTDPLRPEFGTDIWKLIDKPVNDVVANVKKEILTAVELFEKRVEIVRISHTIESSHISFFITYRMVDDDLIDQVNLFYRNGNFVTPPAAKPQLILDAAIPAVYLQLNVAFTIDGAAVLPTPPEMGFSTPAAMLAWCSANWGSYGTWYLLPGRLVVYIFPGLATTASLSITASASYSYRALIPSQLPGDTLDIVFTPDLVDGTAYTGTAFATIADLLAYVKTNFDNAGMWQIEVTSAPGDFNPIDFDELDFNTVGVGYYLALYSPIYNNADITVIKTA